MKVFFCLVFSIFVLGACSARHDSFSRFESIPDSGWPYGDTISFIPAGLDSASSENVSVAVRHSNDYPYRNLWLEVTYGNAPEFRRDTVDIQLADAYGRWHGNGLGPSYQISVPVASRVNLNDSSRVFIRHIMRVDTIIGITSVGLTVESPD